MKKLLVLLTALATVFWFTTSAFSAEICSNCKGGLRNIACDVAGVQEEGACYAFDYDGSDVTAIYDGYCYWSEGNYRAIFSICNCVDPAEYFGEGDMIGVRMTILVNGEEGENGAYWSNSAYGANPAIVFGMFNKTTQACDLEANQDRTFGPGQYYLSDCETPVTTFTGDTDCTVPAANQATKLMTNADAGYAITGPDVTDKLSHWWIDIPPIRIDPAVLHNGETISVRIELLNQGSGGICAECASVCECTIDVAKVCCGAAEETCHLSFPYFASLTAGYWWNGIAIVNYGSEAGTATMTAYEMDGSVGTATVDVPANGMFVDVLPNIPWEGDGLGGVPCYIKVTTYFNSDGFAMMGDGLQANGYLPRRCE